MILLTLPTSVVTDAPLVCGHAFMAQLQCAWGKMPDLASAVVADRKNDYNNAMNSLKSIYPFPALRRARQAALVFAILAAIMLLSGCDLLKAVASSPTAVSGGVSSAQPTATDNTGQGQTVSGAGPVDTLTVGSANLLYWSAVTGSLVVAGDEEVRLMSLPQQGVQAQALDTAPVQPLLAEEPTLLTGAQSAARLAWADSTNQVFTVDPSTGGAAAAVVREAAPVTGLALAPDGNALAVTTTEGSLAIVPQLAQPAGQQPQEFALPAWLTNLSYSPDGKLIGGTDLRNFTVYILNANNGSVVRTLEWFDSPTANLYGAFFSPDWSRIAWVSQTAIQVMNVADGSKGPLLNHEDHISAVAWSPDGTRLAAVSAAYTDDGPAPAVIVWDPATGAPATVLIQPLAVRSLAFSPDGRQIAVIDSQQNLQVWNLEQ